MLFFFSELVLESLERFGILFHFELISFGIQKWTALPRYHNVVFPSYFIRHIRLKWLTFYVWQMY